MSEHKSNTKINNYKILEAFVQLNFLDGFSYIDKAGEIVNSFVRDSKEIPNFQMSPEGLLIQDPMSAVSQLKITPTQIWVHFVEPKNLGNVYKESLSVIDRMVKILKPTIYQRIGWRTYFAYENVNTSNPVDKLSLSKELQDFKLQNIVLLDTFDRVDARLELSPLKNVSSDDKKALLFDIDLSIQGKKLSAKTDLDKLWQTFKSDELLNSLEGLFDNG